ncbi:MAG TPA: type IIL restriction-modification enzyme MmeI, partial [Xanthomonadales bacterium]|nr:type IIL restriction-modification enzyme MmeI [Xanthomonadales bacterium]
MTPAPAAVDAFLARWSVNSGSELANYQLFLTELIALLDLPRPDPASEDTRDNAYVFERRVQFAHGDGSTSLGRIDLYKRGHFVCEAKKVKAGVHTKGFDLALMRARSQAEEYARALPADEGRPPFLIVVDVGHTVDLYAEFSRSGATYTPFPDPSSHRIRLPDLRKPEVIERLRAIWLEPQSLDPSRVAARVTRAIAADLAELARSLESAGQDAETVAGFLTRCLFTLFAEDVELLPPDSFKGLLAECEKHPPQFLPLLAELWRAMDVGGFSVALRSDLLRFNGKLFKQPQVLPLDREQIGLLARAARHDWRHVEPAIFGTLLERALDPTERHALGAHYTPRAYVERLVLPTVIEPLRADWNTAQAAALTLLAEGDAKGAIASVRAFHHELCSVRVLDP